mgnify:FL=1
MYSNYLFSESFESLKGVAIALSRKGIRNIIRKTPAGWSLEVKCSMVEINSILL